MKNVLVIGATSGIGRELCVQYARRGYKVTATGRRQELLASLRESSSNIATCAMDVVDCNAAALLQKVADGMGGIDLVILSAGYGDINQELVTAIELRTVNTNVLGFTDCAAAAYHYLKEHGGGMLAGISSIASFRGGSAGPAYSASKAYVSSYMEGLRVLAYKDKANIKVSTIIPGFVDTALAKSVGEDGSIFWMAPVEKAAGQIISGLGRGKKIIYVTRRWRLVAWALRLLPDFIYKRI
ncbi:MAG: SDR family NAD(P)-dependent oxidoreductase [Prevotellaceae bacterium]|jgi:short-subunit dehydrogenase|nr:SDR family NAD(P)-dependent oxidoreductase [Prevotellaceae bacterium]